MSNEQWDSYSRKEKIYIFCKKIHVLKFAQFINRKVLGNQPAEMDSDISNEPVINLEQNANVELNVSIEPIISLEEESFKKIDDSFSVAIQNFKRIIPSNKRKIIFSGHVLEFDKGMCNYLNQISNACISANAELICLSHAINVKNVVADKKITFDYYTVPYTVGINRYEKNVDVLLPEHITKIIEEKNYLRSWCNLIELRHKDMGKNYAQILAYELYNYFIEFLNHFKPEMVILWCEFYAGHSILKEICEEYGIKILYMEFGSLPGTIAIEESGQMGESLVSINADDFMQKKVSEEELVQAGKVLQFLKESKLNRRPQPESDALEKICRRIDPERPIVVMFGQNDYEAHIKPCTDITKKFHSPIFESSDDAAKYVGILAKKNRWNFIYKPHQMMVRVGECLEEDFPESTIWIGDSDINDLIDIADVCITIVSQCGYVSLIREKPVVMLGYTQLKGKGCTYEAFEKNIVEDVIKIALDKGYTNEQKKLFQKHVAQLLKYYLFDDLQQEIGFGQSIDSAKQYILNHLNGIESANNTYSMRRALIACKTPSQIKSAILLSQNFNDSVQTDLLVIGTQCSEQIPEQLNKYFEYIFQISGEEDYLHEEVSTNESIDHYDDIFLTYYDSFVIALYRELACYNQDLYVHFYDTADLEFYIKHIGKDIENNKKNKVTHVFFSNISEICLYDRRLKVWKESLNFPMTVMPLTDYRYINNIEEEPVSKINYVYIESPLFARRYTTNEVELINCVNETMAENRLVVCINEENNIDLYSSQGYPTNRDIDLILSEKGAKTYVFSTYIERYFIYSLKHYNVVYVDLSELVTGNFNLLYSNSYKKLKNILDEMNLCNYYRPQNLEALNELMIYEGGR